MEKTEILSLTPEEIADFLPEEPAYRATQIFEWLHRNGITSFEEMSNQPKTLRTRLENLFFITQADVADKKISADGTEKFLLKLGDAYVESVKMSYKHGESVCISTQAGCKMGCRFCASATGFQRNLTAGEYCVQIYNLVSPVKETVRSAVSSIVLMGCGEPLDNYDATVKFIGLITHPKGKNISARHITVSTCGLVPRIYALAERRLQITLAVSLHAPDDETRQALMPVAKTYPLRELIDACRHYAEVTRRRITFEYALARDINDSPAQAKALAKLLQGRLCHVNLIPVNNIGGGFSPTPPHAVKAFAAALKESNISVTVRRSLGADINAACGQLRARRASNLML